jgi:hypothetical protein
MTPGPGSESSAGSDSCMHEFCPRCPPSRVRFAKNPRKTAKMPKLVHAKITASTTTTARRAGR